MRTTHNITWNGRLAAFAAFALLAVGVAAADAHPRVRGGFRSNPPGPVGGPGTNWANPPGPRGGPGTSPFRVRPRFDRDHNPPGRVGGPGTNWENPPGPRGGRGASPNRRRR